MDIKRVNYTEAERIFANARYRLRHQGIDAQAVAWVQRQDNAEFAKCRKGWGDEELLELLTQPGTPLRVTRETATYTFIALDGIEIV